MPGQRNQYRQGQGRNGQLSLDFSYAQVQPQALEVEKAVLGALMIDKDAYLVISELLRPESFYEPRHQKIFDAVRQLSMNERPIDVLTVTEQLSRNGVLEEIGGPGYIAELSSRVATSANLEYHANIVAEKYISRQLITYTSTIGKKAFDETCDPKDVIAEAESMLFDIAQTNVKKDYVHVSPLIKEASQIMMAASKNNGDVTGISTGYKRLDDLTSGWQSSDLVIIAGRPAMGKTAFALSMAKNIAADQNVPMAFFSLEMSGVQLVNRLIANTCEIEGMKILNGSLNAEVQLIMVDYLQLMNANGMRFNSRQEEVSTISRSLKILAKELNIPVIALSQLNRGLEARTGADGKRPMLSDLRESGAIEQDADMVIFVHRPEKFGLTQGPNGEDYLGKAEIIIAKHRKGATDTVLLDFKGEYTRFENPEDNILSGMPLGMGGEIVGLKINGDSNQPVGVCTFGDVPIELPPPINTAAPY